MDSNTDEEDLHLLMNAHPQPEPTYIMIFTVPTTSVMSTPRSGFDLNAADNSYLYLPQCMIKEQDYEALYPYLLWLPIDCIKHMLTTSTKWFCNVYGSPFHKHFKSHFPASNVTHHNEPVATNTMFSDEAVLGSYATTAQIFVGCNSKYIDVYGAALDHDLSHTLEEDIMNQGAMNVLISNNACAAPSQKVKDIICMYCIKSHTSEPHHQHQNYTECCIGHIKDVMNCIVTFTGAPNNLWLLCLMYEVYILNITANSTIGDISPHQHLYGRTLNIPPALCF